MPKLCLSTVDKDIVRVIEQKHELLDTSYSAIFYN